MALRFRTPREGTLRLEAQGRRMPHSLPKHVQPFAEYMRMRGKPSARDVLKAYLITMSSIQRQSAPKSTLCRAWPSLRKLRLPTRVRPEDLFSLLLQTPPGKQFLDAGERGEYDHAAARELIGVMRCYGLVFAAPGADPKHEGLFKNVLPYAVKNIVPKAKEIARLISSRKVPPKVAYQYVHKNIRGISAAKTGFFLSVLGRGDIPTLDAKELDLWVSEWSGQKPTVSWKDVEQQIRIFNELPFKLPKADRRNRMHLQHHAIWDAAAGSETGHEEVIQAMQLAGGRYLIVSG